MSLEQNSLQGYEPIDSIEQDVPLGHGVQQNFGADTRKTGKGKRASFWKGKGGRQYARRPDGRIITHDAEELGGDDASLANFSGVDSVVVEAPLGHGATQYYAEDEPEPQFNDGITGQDGPIDEPTNSQFCSECGHGFAADETRCNPPCTPREMIGQSWWKKLGYNSPCGCAHVDSGGAYMDAEHNHWHNKKNGQFYGKWSKHRKNGQFSTHNSEYPKSLSCAGCNRELNPNRDKHFEYNGEFMHYECAKEVFDVTAWEDVAVTPSFSAQGYDDKQDESIGMRHRGRHSQSRKDRRDEASAMDRKGRMGRKYDDVATMDAEHNHWHNKKNGQFYGKWSKHRKNGQFSTHNSEYSQIMGPTVEANEGGLHSPSSFDISWEDGSGQSSASMPPNGIHFADFTLEKPVKTGFMVAFGAGLFSLAAVAGTVLIGNLLGGNE
jgi:hypothetical protein